MRTIRAALSNKRTAACGIVGAIATLLPLVGVPLTGPVAAVVALASALAPHVAAIFAADAQPENTKG